MKDNDQSLVSQMGDTKERLAAWVTRGLIILLGVSASIIGWFAQGTLNDLKTAIDHSVHNQTEMAVTMGTLTQTVADGLKVSADAVERIDKEQDDHENRIRTLEKGSNPQPH